MDQSMCSQTGKRARPSDDRTEHLHPSKRRTSQHASSSPHEKAPYSHQQGLQLTTSASNANTRDGGEQPLTNDQYTVGWIAALPHEAVAAKAALDQFYGRAPLTKNAADQNSYILGRIGDHNVVIASLPGGVMGTTAAATAAMHMLSSFPSLRIGLMVGIGAGIPKVKRDRKTNRYRELRDIRLGDVVVSQPGGGLGGGGVYQYDLGKAVVGGEFRPTGFLNSPPRALLNAVSVLRQLHEAGESRLPHLLNEMLQKLSNARPSYAFPGRELDRLFDAAYPHPEGEEDCDDCLEDMEIDRAERSSVDPVLHCGVIASGNLVVKDPAVRDRFSDCICFEMEAAGLMNDFPCLVFRGICDYADSHKNDGWQRYAAVAAAACAKEALLEMPKVEVEGERLAREVLQVAQTAIDSVSENVELLQQDLEQRRKNDILDWLSNVNYTAIKADALEKKCDETGQWILTLPVFQAWIEGDNPTLFCSGVPGGGKTMTASVVIEYLMSRCKGGNTAVAFLYCKHDMRNEQSSRHLLAALLKQLAENTSQLAETTSQLAETTSQLAKTTNQLTGTAQLHEAITHLDEECQKKRRPTIDELTEAILTIARTYDGVYFVVDGLDECLNLNHDICPHFLDRIRYLQKTTAVKLLVTSRDIPIIQKEFQHDLRLEIAARKEDVLRHLQSRRDISGVMQRNKALKVQIAKGISDMVEGMFLLADLYFDLLKPKRTERDVKEALSVLKQGPRGLKALKRAYHATIQRIDDQQGEDREWAYKVLRWVANAEKSMSVKELETALTIRLGDCRIDEKDLLDCSEVVSLCAGLVIINRSSNTVHLAHYTTREYLNLNPPNWMASAQTKISTTCLTYLTFEDFSCGRATCDQSFEERIDRHKLLRYASRHWGHHARKCEQELLQNENFVNILRKFLGNRSLTYAAGQASNAEGYWNGYSQEPAYWLWSHTLASFGLVEIFTRILSLHNGSHFEITDIDFEDEHCIMTPLALACSRGHEETVKVLLDSDVRLDSGVAFGYPTPLGHAINNGHHAVVQLFIDLRPDAVDLNSITHCRRRPPLTAAARNGFYDTVDVLIHHGQGRVAVDTIKDINRRTPLSYAAQFGHYKIVQLLTSLPAVNPNRKDKFGNTPLMLAAQNGHAEIVNLLMDLGPEKVNANHTNVSGRTALQEATVHNHLEAVEALVAYPPDRVDVNVCTEAFMQTALAYAAEKGLETIARALVSLGPGRVHLDAMGWRGTTPLLCAAREGHVGIVELLTDYAQEVVDVNAVDVDGCTPLICAVQNEHYETAEFLVGLGERVDAGIADVRGFTARDYAFRREEKFEKLLPEP